MTPPKVVTPSTPKDTKTPQTSAAQAAKPAEVPKPAEPTQAAGKSGKDDTDRRIVSVAFPVKLARQLKLLSSVSGESIAAIVVASVTRTINKKLPAALAEIAKSGDVDDEA